MELQKDERSWERVVLLGRRRFAYSAATCGEVVRRTWLGAKEDMDVKNRFSVKVLHGGLIVEFHYCRICLFIMWMIDPTKVF